MPTIFSHAIFAAATGKAAVSKSVSVWFWILTALCAIVPDFDVVGFSFGINYGSMFGHRGFTHSIVFALLFGSFVAFLVNKFLNTGFSIFLLIIYFSLATFSHPFFDMFTDGGLGVALFAPFSGERYFFPWRPIQVSPIGLEFFSERGISVILSEIVWVWIPAFFVLLLMTIFRKFKKN